MAVAQSTRILSKSASTTSEDATEEKEGLGLFSKVIQCLLELCYEPAKELCVSTLNLCLYVNVVYSYIDTLVHAKGGRSTRPCT